MTDRKELSISHGPCVSRRPLPVSLNFSPPEPIWRYRPPIGSDAIARSIRTQMLPHVGLALRSMSFPPSPEAAEPAAPFEVQQFTLLILSADEVAAFAYVENLISRGMAIDLIFLNLLGPVARRLGEMWEDDTTDFANVTLGVSKLQRVMRHLGETSSSADDVQRIGSVLLTTVPGEQHSFGLAMVAEFFRQDGWDICTGPFSSPRELSSLVTDRWFDLIGFSLTSDRRIDELKRLIQDVRRLSRNRWVGVIIGGPILVNRPELANLLGADMSATDGAHAPQLARALLPMLKGRR